MKFFATICFLMILSVEALACKYSVRDVAFVNLDQHSYHLYLVTDQENSQKELTRIDHFRETLFKQSNIHLHALSQDEFEDEIILDEPDEINNPRLVLVDQNGRHFSESLRKEIPVSEKEFLKFIKSPLRTKLIPRLLQVHSVVLLLEGQEEKWNKRAEAIISESIKTITGTMQDLPKKISKPPLMVRLSRNQQKKEKVLLWSLGIDEPISEEARIVILYGRGRLLGPAFRVPGITQTELSHYLNYVGQDCECELDRSGMQGIMIPLKWGLQAQIEAKELLGFNPENEFIKEEVSQILERGSKQSGKLIDRKIFQSDPLLGYSEIDIQPSENRATKTVKDDRGSNLNSGNVHSKKEPTPQFQHENNWVNSFFITFLIMLMVYLAARTTSKP